MPTLTLTLDGNKFILPPESYVYDHGENSYYRCTIAVSRYNGSTRLGAAFFRNYVIALNYDENKLFIAVSKDAPSGVSINDGVDDSGLSVWAIVGISAGGLVGLVILIVVVCCICKGRKK